jgi:hypothetical protein
LAAAIGEDRARAAVAAGWKALREAMASRPDLVHPGVADYVTATVLLGALPALTDPNAGVPDVPVVDSASARIR